MESQLIEHRDVIPDLTVEEDNQCPEQPASTVNRAPSKYLQDIQLAAIAHQGDERGFMLALVELRRGIDRSPQSGNWVQGAGGLSSNKQAYAKTLIQCDEGKSGLWYQKQVQRVCVQHATIDLIIILRAGCIEVGAALRKKVEVERAEQRDQKTRSRLTRWMSRDKVKNPAYPALDTMVKANQFWLLAASPTSVLLVQTLGVFQKFKNGYKPFKEVALTQAERVQLRVFQPSGEPGAWKHAEYSLCQTMQQLVCCLPPNAVNLDLASHTAHTCPITQATIQQLLPILPSYFANVLGQK